VESPDFTLDDRRGVFPASAAYLAVDERLHSETNAIDSGGSPRPCKLCGDAAGGRFEGRLSPRTSRDQIQEAAKGVGSQRGRSTSAEVHRVGRPSPVVGGDFTCEDIEVPGFEFARKNSRREIAVGTLLGTKRVGDVNAWHVSTMIARG